MPSKTITDRNVTPNVMQISDRLDVTDSPRTSSLAPRAFPSPPRASNLAPRLLFLTHRFPYPPNRGDRIRSYNMLRVLAESFDVTLVCPHDEPVSDEQLRHVRQFCDAVHTEPIGAGRWVKAGCSALAGRSLTEGLFHNRGLKRSILKDHERQRFDAILVFCSSMYPYIDHPRFRGVRTVVDLVDVDSMKWEQLARESSLLKRPVYAVEANRISKLEQRIADRVDAIALVSDHEAAAFRDRVNSNAPILGISNGVDTGYFRPHWATSPNGDESRGARREERGARREKDTATDPDSSSRLAPRTSRLAPRLVFTGVLDYTPNVEGMRWFCERILPRLRKDGDFQLDIVGRRANAVVQRLAAIDGVNLVGEVPDVRPHLHAADIAISPLKLARGIQNKVLEAMACGLPVVTTTQSAEGIDAVDGRELVIADDEDQWHAALFDLAGDPDKREALGTAARNLVVDHYSWQSKLQQLGDLLAASSA